MKCWRNGEEVRVCVVLVSLVEVERVAGEGAVSVSTIAVVVAIVTYSSEASAAARPIWLV